MRKLLALVVSFPLAASFYLACSGDNSPGDAGDGSLDVRAEKPVIQDTGTVETGPTCAPGPFDGSTLTWQPPHAAQPTACSSQQLNDYYTNCWNAQTKNTNNCNAWKTANPACLSCMYSNELGDAGSWSTIINTGTGVVYPNTGGCIALELNDTSATGCGAKAWFALDCQDDTCAPSCPIDPNNVNASFQAYNACLQQAAQEGCKSLLAAECDLSDAGSVLTACDITSNATFQTKFFAIGAVMCGGYPADAGTDAGSDAGSDAGLDAGSDASDASADAPDGD